MIFMSKVTLFVYRIWMKHVHKLYIIHHHYDYDGDDKKIADNINAAMETADEQYPDDILDPDAIQPVSDELADDFIEEELKLSTSFAPALDTVSDEAAEHSMEDEDLSKENLDEELELLFSDDKADDAELEGLELSLDDEEVVDDESGELTPDLEVALADVDQKDEDSLDFDENLFLAEDDEDKGSPAGDEDIVTPALAESGEKGGFREDVESAGLAEEPATELEDKLDSFFDISEEEQDIDISDPLEPVNRFFFQVNDKLYFWVLKPVGRVYGAVIAEDFLSFSQAEGLSAINSRIRPSCFDGGRHMPPPNESRSA